MIFTSGRGLFLKKWWKFFIF